ncbi:beta-ketoacyl-ACP synthase II [Campylobacterota bacterium]|nr:beta-ketoacyl-ACP synthase II [Campylobacterota bacterium]
MNRVVITGAGVYSPYGSGRELLANSLLAGESGISFCEELKDIPSIKSLVAGIAPKADFSHIPHTYRRSMSKMSLFAMSASLEALKTAGYETAPDETALYIGSTVSSMESWLDISNKFSNRQLALLKTTAVFKLLNSSPLANLTQALNIKGQGLGINNACATGLVNAGLAYLLIRAGVISSALAGGTDEYHPIMTGCFSVLNAASDQYNETPSSASRPFDRDRCGIVCSEGCGMLYMETLDSAVARGATILAEILGFATNTETKSIAHPSRESITECISLALKNARIPASEIDLINAHSTSTIAGDIEEAQSIAAIFGDRPLVNSLKGHIGHTMAASGSMELIATIDMVRMGRIAATLNLENVDTQCGGINHIQNTTKREVHTFMKNSFALGGTNASMVIRRF